ncbi:YqaJ viral recombinase family protein [Thermoactinospora rubra]|uniref:YqaJ viral recombinase family nuclease n=1 Tax=Thermoactinospora rubra TaxID=1088767 RepID=UPI000A111E66|nr:YqaJ viral recombinase family protein [Thermoactinospora rubra]
MSTDLLTPTARLLAPSGLSRDEWLKVRRQGIGGSDVAAILGMDRRRGPLEVYLDKRGELEQQRDVQLERSARRGDRLEGLVAEFFGEETGRWVVDSPGTLQHAERPYMLANPDRFSFLADGDDLSDPAVLECKTRTWRSARREDWHGEEPPDGPALQAYWYCAVTGYTKAHVAGLVDDDFIYFELAHDAELIDHLVKVVSDFWHNHVVAGVPPEPGDLESTGELLNHLWDVSADSVKLFTPEEVAEADKLLARREEIIRERKKLKRELGAVENKLKARLGDAEIALAPGRELYSWRRNGNFAPKRFREAHPDLAAAHRRQVDALDIEAIKTHHPDEYRAHRARVLRVPGSTS